MKLYIPSHLKKIKIVSQLVKMYNEYLTGTDNNGVSYFQEEEDSLSSYKEVKSIDPVKKFIETWIDRDKFKDQDVTWVISYFVKYFYSIKGTIQVIEKLKELLKLNITSYSYSIDFLKLSIDISQPGLLISIEEADLFKSDLIGFLNELLYFHSNDLEISGAIINVADDMKRYIDAKLISYNVENYVD